MPIVGCRMYRGLVLIRRTGTRSKGNYSIRRTGTGSVVACRVYA